MKGMTHFPSCQDKTKIQFIYENGLVEPLPAEAHTYIIHYYLQLSKIPPSRYFLCLIIERQAGIRRKSLLHWEPNEILESPGMTAGHCELLLSATSALELNHAGRKLMGDEFQFCGPGVGSECQERQQQALLVAATAEGRHAAEAV